MRADHRRADQRVLVLADDLDRLGVAAPHVDADDPAFRRVLVSAEPQPVADGTDKRPVIIDAGDERPGFRARLVERNKRDRIARVGTRR